MFVLRKTAVTSATHIPVQVEAKLEPLAYDVERSSEVVIYKVSSFAPGIRYSMFAPFAEIALLRAQGSWVLRLKPTKVLLLPFAFSLAGLLRFRSIGPIGTEGVALAIALPSAVVVFSIGEAWLRIANWWRQL